MRFRALILAISVLGLFLSMSPTEITGQTTGNFENPKIAILGTNAGNISANEAGGRFFFNFTLDEQKSYDFELNGDPETKFDLFFFDRTYLPSLIVDERAEFTDKDSYPVKIEGYSSTDDWVLIQVFSNHINGGTGDFTLDISEWGTSTLSSSDHNENTSNGDEESASTSRMAFLGIYTLALIFRFRRTS